MNVITKSGSNAFNGSLATYYTNNTLQSKNYFQKQAAGFQHPDYGRTEVSWGFGGPVKRDRTFFFTSGDVLRSDVAVSGARTILTPAFIRFMEQARRATLDLIAKNFPASFTPESTSDRRPAPNPPVRDRRDCLADRAGAMRSAGHRRRDVERDSPRNGLSGPDASITLNGGKDRIYGSFNRTTTQGRFGTPEVYPGFTASSPTSSITSTPTDRIVSPSVVNEVSFGW